MDIEPEDMENKEEQWVFVQAYDSWCIVLIWDSNPQPFGYQSSSFKHRFSLMFRVDAPQNMAELATETNPEPEIVQSEVRTTTESSFYITLLIRDAQQPDLTKHNHVSSAICK